VKGQTYESLEKTVLVSSGADLWLPDDLKKRR
jgi:hypothetical protein